MRNEIKTLSPAQQESVFSFVYLLKHPEHQPASGQESIEPFASEQEALDFVNDYAKRILFEARCCLKPAVLSWVFMGYTEPMLRIGGGKQLRRPH
jgi:hypothetical protein